MKTPAIEGGTAIRKKFLVFGKPRITKAEEKEVLDTIRSGWLGTGPKTKQFEILFAKFTNSKHAIALNSCTAALHLALDVLGIRDGDEVITTPLTFSSTANVIEHHRARPVFADVDPQTWNISPQKVNHVMNKKVKAIIPVDLHGRPYDHDAINTIAKNNNAYVIEDAAHAAEARYKEQPIGAIADLTAFSFYVTKNIMTGEGGMLTTNNDAWAQESRIRSLHGISKDAWKRYSSEGYSPYETLYPGYKYNMMDLVASFGIHQLADVEKNWLVRKKYWDMYNEAFRNVANLITPIDESPGDRHARHLYALLLPIEKLKISRDKFIDALRCEGIGSGVHFSALHLHKYYREKYHYKHGDFPIAEFIGERTISLPLSPSMKVHDVEDVIAAVVKLLSFYKK